MRTMLVALFIVVSASVLPARASDESELACLTEAILAESTLSKESLKSDKLVGYSMKMRMLDGQWGPTYCSVINTRWLRKGYRVVKGKRGKARRVAYTYYSYDYKYKEKPYYKNIVAKSPPARVAQAREAAEDVYYDRYVPEEKLRETKQYMYVKYASAKGKFWFECVTKHLGKAEPESVHDHYRDATEEELQQKLLQTPACKASIADFRWSRDRNRLRKQEAAAH